MTILSTAFKTTISLFFLAVTVSLVGCSTVPQTGTSCQTGVGVQTNPVFIQKSNPHETYELVIDVLDDYFDISMEKPIRDLGAVQTEGRIETFPKIGATIFEPWHGDSVTCRDRIECTLQPIRRRAVARIIPMDGGYNVEILAYKELEAVERPDHMTAGAAVFRHDTSPVRRFQAVSDLPESEGWIPQGRDILLEQRILQQLVDQAYRM
jgi:hypothetical protein